MFQGRFKAQLIEDLRGVREVGRYLHLNPVRIKGLELGKAEAQRQRTAAAKDPGPRQVDERLEVLRTFRWSSWRVYGGTEASPEWLTLDVIAP